MNASGRHNTCKLYGIGGLAPHESGVRVRNGYATCIQLGDSPSKEGLIPHNMVKRHLLAIKAPAVGYGHA